MNTYRHEGMYAFMPWSVVADHADCSEDSPWAVVNDESGEVEGCHDTEDAANEQAAALYASEEEDTEATAMQADPLMNAVYAAFPEPAEGAAEFDASQYQQGLWTGILAVEDTDTGDSPRRNFAPGSLSWRDLPLSIYWQKVTAEGHSNAMIVARVDSLTRETVTLDDGRAVPGIRAHGHWDLGSEDGRESHRLVGQKFMRGVSVTVDDVADSDVELVFPEVDPSLPPEEAEMAEMFAMPERVVFKHARIMDACLTGQPALKEAFVELVPDSVGAPAPVEAEDDETDSLEAMTAALDDALAPNTSVAVVVVPNSTNGLAVADGLPNEELHVTLGYYGHTDTVAPETIGALKAWVQEHGDLATLAQVSGVARMGSDDPQAVALLIESADLASARAALEAVAAPDGTHPHFTPHLTLGYGVPIPDTLPTDVDLGSVELWVGDEHYGAKGLIASAFAPPVAPPLSWFQNPRLSGPTAPTYLDSGQAFGHFASWGECHLSFMPNVCVTPPRNGDYSAFKHGVIVTAEGAEVRVGQITLGTNHAPVELGQAPALAHYDNTGTAVVDVAIGEDAHGVWFAGAVRPDVSPKALRVLRASGVSGDWRKVRGQWTVAGILVVNVPGFKTPRLRTHIHNGEQQSLVASGVMLSSSGRRASSIPAVRSSIADRIARTIGRDPATRLAALRSRVHG